MFIGLHALSRYVLGSDGAAGSAHVVVAVIPAIFCPGRSSAAWQRKLQLRILVAYLYLLRLRVIFGFHGSVTFVRTRGASAVSVQPIRLDKYFAAGTATDRGCQEL